MLDKNLPAFMKGSAISSHLLSQFLVRMSSLDYSGFRALFCGREAFSDEFVLGKHGLTREFQGVRFEKASLHLTVYW